MKLSIITINYNNVVGLKDTLQSVVTQTCQEYEHIIIDGGSTDGSVPVIKYYEEQIIAKRSNLNIFCPQITWISELDGGIYEAMNKGIAKSSGEYLYFLNSGDTLVDEYVIEKLMDELVFVGEDIIVSRINFTDSVGRYHADYQLRMPKVSLFHFMQTGIPHQSALIHRSLFEQYGLYDVKYRIVADWEFFLRALVVNNASLRYTDITIANFDGTGLTSTHGKEMMDEIEKVVQDTFPKRVIVDYRWMQSCRSDLQRIEWLQEHSFLHGIVKAIVGLGRKIYR